MHKLSNRVRVLLNAFAVFLLFFTNMEITVSAQDADYETGYAVIIEDDADLLTDAEEKLLAGTMKEITAYGNVAFKTINENGSSTKVYIEDYYAAQFGSDSGIVFLIDMDNRNIWIHCNGAIYKIITGSYADTITDNVYQYASDAEYYECANQAFSQALALLQGNKIAQPMKYISNAFLALILALIINYFVVKLLSMAVKPNDKQLLEATRNGFRYENAKIKHTGTTRRYDPPSSGGGGGGGRSGGGGGRSGGGGGHSF